MDALEALVARFQADPCCSYCPDFATTAAAIPLGGCTGLSLVVSVAVGQIWSGNVHIEIQGMSNTCTEEDMSIVAMYRLAVSCRGTR